MPSPKVTVVTIMYGDRWKFLSQVVVAVMKDTHVIKLIIVDNGSAVPGQIQEGVEQYGDRVEVIATGKNLGSAGGFAKGIKSARETDCDYVFLLDDDSVPEVGFVDSFMNVLKYFPEGKVVLSGNRVNVPGNQEFFHRPSLTEVSPRGTFFQVFNFGKILNFFRLLRGLYKKGAERGPFLPIAPTEAFVYGAAFIPIDAVRRAPLPDASLFLYGDDVEYSWGVKNLGYDSYISASPKIYDVDLTFGEGSHIIGQFEPGLRPFKVYYRLRNMVRLSRKHSKQNPIVLFLSIFVWVAGLFILGLIKRGPTKFYFERVWVLCRAVCAGYFPNSKIAQKTEASFF